MFVYHYYLLENNYSNNVKASNNKGVRTVDGFVLNDIFSKNIKKTIIYVDSSCWVLPKTRHALKAVSHKYDYVYILVSLRKKQKKLSCHHQIK